MFCVLISVCVGVSVSVCISESCVIVFMFVGGCGVTWMCAYSWCYGDVS